eukprot:6492676-Amphidinium_carterae.1
MAAQSSSSHAMSPYVDNILVDGGEFGDEFEGYEPNARGNMAVDDSATYVDIAAQLMQQHTQLFNVNVAAPSPPPQVVVVETPRDNTVEFLENQILGCQTRERILQEEFHLGQNRLTNVNAEVQVERSFVREWLQREGEQASRIQSALEQETRQSQLHLQMLEQSANINHAREVQRLEQCALGYLSQRREEHDVVQNRLLSEEEVVSRMRAEGTNLVAEVSSLENNVAQAQLQAARRESEQHERERVLEDGTRTILHEMAGNVSTLSNQNQNLRSELQEAWSERLGLEAAVDRVRMEFLETCDMHRVALSECASLQKSMHEMIHSSGQQIQSITAQSHLVQPPLTENEWMRSLMGKRESLTPAPSTRVDIPFTAPSSVPIRTQGLRDEFGRNLGYTSGQVGDNRCALGNWTEVFTRPPSAGPTPAPGLTAVSGPLSLSPHLGHTNCTSHAHGEVAYVPPSFTPSVQVTSCSGSEELRRDRSKLPRCDVHVDSSNPAATIMSWETWVLQVGLTISSWLKVPSAGVEWWNGLLRDATEAWRAWSAMTPIERSVHERTEASCVGGYVAAGTSPLEATLRIELCENLPQHIVKKCMSEQKVSALQLLTAAMKLLLPSSHSVKTALLDSCERLCTQRFTTASSLLQNIRAWLQTLKVTMGRYGITPDSRRLWLALQSRYIQFVESNPTLSALVAQHLQQTQVRTHQTLDSVLAFSVALEAELAALIQDTPPKKDVPFQQNEPKAPQAKAAMSSDQGKSDGKNHYSGKNSGSSSGQTSSLCTFFGTVEGCKFGQTCKHTHPFVRPGSNLCFICGSSAHKASECTRPRRGPGDKASQSRGRSASKDRSRPSTPNRQNSQEKGKKKGGGAKGASGKAARSSSQKSDKSREADADVKDSKTASGKVAVVRALSVELPSVHGDVVLDSGASHVVLPYTWATDEQKSASNPIDLCMASGKAPSIISHGEVFSRGVRRPLIPFGKLVDRTGMIACWSTSALLLQAQDAKGRLRTFMSPTMRQSMPHIPMSALQGFRQALMSTRLSARVLSYEEWIGLLGDSAFQDGQPFESSVGETCGYDSCQGLSARINCDVLDARHEQVIQRLSDVMTKLEDMCKKNKIDSDSSPFECVELDDGSDLPTREGCFNSSSVCLGVSLGQATDGDCGDWSPTALPADTDESDEESTFPQIVEREWFGGDGFDSLEADGVEHGLVLESDAPTTKVQLVPDIEKHWDLAPGTDCIPCPDLKTYLQHVQDGHFPKLAQCPICQLSCGPVFRHAQLDRVETGKLAIDLTGPLASDIVGHRYIMVGVYVGMKVDSSTSIQHSPDLSSRSEKKKRRKDEKRNQELLLPFIQLLETREGEEVAEALKNMIGEVESVVTPLLPAHFPVQPRVLQVHLHLSDDSAGDLPGSIEQLEAVLKPWKDEGSSKCVLRVHSDNAAELVSQTVKGMLGEHSIFQSTTAAHSSSSNGRAECAIRVVKSMIRRALHSSNLPAFVWGFASTHVAQTLRAHSLRKAGHEHVKIPPPFGTFVALRRQGEAKKFGPFENRGVLGRLLLENTTTSRECAVLTSDNEIVKGFASQFVFPGSAVTEDECSKYDHVWEEFGWSRLTLDNGLPAWLHQESKVLALSPPKILDVVPLVDETSQDGSLERDDRTGDFEAESEFGNCSMCLACDGFSAEAHATTPAVKASIPVPKYVDCVDEVALRELCGQVLAYLDEYTLPQQRTRTNVYGDSEFDSPRGCLLGCFTTRGFGITAATRKHAPLVQLVHQIASLRSDNTPYGSVYISLVSGLPLHVDKNNEGTNDLLVMGKFGGGKIFVEHPSGSLCSIHGQDLRGFLLQGKLRFVRFSPSCRHAVQSASGQRVSIVFFTPRFMEKLLPSHVDELVACGFRVAELSIKGLKGRNCIESLGSPLIAKTCDGLGSSTCSVGVSSPSCRSSGESSASVCPVFDLTTCDEDVPIVGPSCLKGTRSKTVDDRVSFQDPVVDMLATYDVYTVMKSTSGSRMLMKTWNPRRTERNLVEESCSLAALVPECSQTVEENSQATELSLPSVACIGVPEMQTMPQAESLRDLAKAIPIALDAVRGTSGEEREKWKTSLQRELDNLKSQKTYVPVARPKGYIPPARCVFTIKPTQEGVPKRKSRIVLCGNFIQPFSAASTSNLDSAVLRLALHVMVQRSWMLCTLDIPGAFLHAELDDSRAVICAPPRILTEMNLVPEGECWRLTKALYGLREAPKIWEESRDRAVADFRFSALGLELCLVQSAVHASLWLVVTTKDAQEMEQRRKFRPVNKRALQVLEETEHLVDLQTVFPVHVYGLVTIYVDDIAPIGPVEVVRQIAACFDVKYGSGPGLILGVDVDEVTHLGLQICCPELERNSHGKVMGYQQVIIHQTRYTEEIIQRHPDAFTSPKTSPSPQESWKDSEEDACFGKVDETLLKKIQQIGGAILWLVVKSRPDLSWSYSKIASLQGKNTSAAWQRLKHLCGYVLSRPDLGIKIEKRPKSEMDLQLFADISFSPEGDRSPCGVVALLRNNCVTWRTFKQSLTTVSTCESELIASQEGLETGRIIQLLLSEVWAEEFPRVAHVRLQYSPTPFQLNSDNQAAISQALKANRNAFRTRHISYRGNRVADAIDEKTCVLSWVATKSQVADHLTKPVPGPLVNAMIEQLGLARVDDM